VLQLHTSNEARQCHITEAELKWLLGKRLLVFGSLQGEEGSGERGYRIGGLGSKSLREESVVPIGTVIKSLPAVALYWL